MPNRTVADFMKIVDGKIPKRKRGSTSADKPDPAASGAETKRLPRPPKHFTAAERQAWRDITRRIVIRGAWTDELSLWCESFAVLLAASRSDVRHDPSARMINRSQLRLYGRDLIQLIAHGKAL